MRDIASHIYDIAENSINAGAELIHMDFEEVGNTFRFTIRDDGCGMSAQMLEAVKDPFVTTRKTRKVGMGIPLLIQNTEATGGTVILTSKEKVGTVIEAVFKTDNIDCPPLGDIPDVMVNLAIGNSHLNFCMNYLYGKHQYTFDTREVKMALEGVSINDLEVVAYLKEMVNENIANIRGQNID